MHALNQYLGYLNLALYTLVALVALRQWRAGRGPAGLWAALTFGALALVVDVAQALPEDPDRGLEAILERLLVAVLVLFPYLLYRFTTAFQAPTRRLERFVGLMTAAIVIWTFALPSFPAEGEPRPAFFIAYLVGFLVHWTALTVIVSVRLWRAGRGLPSVARLRMQVLAAAAATITVAILAAAADPAEDSPVGLAATFLVTIAALTFLLGLAPPSFVRFLWRRPEQERLQGTIADLMRATSEEEVAERVLPPMARLVGARALALERADGRLIGVYEASAAMLAELSQPGSESSPLRLEVASDCIFVWMSPYAPYFGTEELELLEALGALTGLALDRTRLFAQEREARLALERADEYKTNFIALAAHELRTPVTSVHGIVETLRRLDAQLSEQTRHDLKDALFVQAERMQRLVEQLLDLSRLDAEAVKVEPQPIRVRERVEYVAAAAAGERLGDLEIDVEQDLVALVDPNAFDLVLSNLVQNALRYGQAPVRVQASQTDRHFRLAVEDRGAGVPPEFVADLFERFARGSDSSARSAGTGLGLAIARSYAQAHRGDLFYEPAKPRGARFELVLPAAAQTEEDVRLHALRRRTTA